MSGTGQSPISSSFGQSSCSQQPRSSTTIDPFAPRYELHSETRNSLFSGSVASENLNPTSGATSFPALFTFGSSTSAFRASPVPAFAAKSVFGSSCNPSASTSTSVLGASPSPAVSVGSSSSPYGRRSTSLPFGSPSAPAFSAFRAAASPLSSSTSASGAYGTATSPFLFLCSSHVFGASLTPTPVVFGASSAQLSSSTSAFAPASDPSLAPPIGVGGSFPSPFGSSTSISGSSFAPTPGFEYPALVHHCRGSRVAHYTSTPEDGSNGGNYVSICAVKSYISKSHEELRIEDYQLDDKRGCSHASQSQGPIGVVASQANHSSSSAAHSNISLFSPVPVYPEPFAPLTSIGRTLGTGGSCCTEVSPFLNPAIPLSPPSSFTFQISSANATGTGGPRFGTESGGSRLIPYIATLDEERNKIQSISAMFLCGNKSHEELRLMDYYLGDKGGCQKRFRNGETLVSPLAKPFHQPTNPFSSQTWPPFTEVSTTHKPSQNCFFCSNPLLTETNSLNTPNVNASSTALTSISSNMIPPTNLFSVSAPLHFSSSLSPSPTSSFSVVNSTSAPGISSGTSSCLNNINSQLLQPFQSYAPLDCLTRPYIGPSAAPAPTQDDFLNSSPVSLNPWANLPSSTTGSSAAEQEKGGLCSEGHQDASGSTEAMHQSVVTNPFGDVATKSVDHSKSTSSIQYGISSRPVSNSPAPVKKSSLLRVRHVSLNQNRLKAEKCNAKSDRPKVAFFSDKEKTSGILKEETSVVPRKNPRSWVSSPSEELIPKAYLMWPGLQSTSINFYDEGITRVTREVIQHSSDEEDLNAGVHGHQDYEVSNHSGDNAELEEIMPKLPGADYYTEPPIQEIAATEKAEPGSCHHVKDFMVGRRGYGSFKFLGETDILKLDLASVVQFNYRELMVYMDESKRPPVGQGLNKPAEVTLLNVKCVDKKTGKQYIRGPKVDQYRAMLIKKGEGQGAEFISFDPVLGEWKFRVQHF